MHELITFAFEASALQVACALSVRPFHISSPYPRPYVAPSLPLQATKRHIALREEEAGPRGVREGLMRGLMAFESTLGLDERQLAAVNLTSLKDEL